MQRMQWSPELKAEALELLASVGKAETARRLGIPAGTIASWGARGGVTAPSTERMRPVVEAMQLSAAQRRVNLGEKFLEKAEKLIDAVLIGEPAVDRKRGIEAARVAAETAQLLTGQPTSRVDAMLGTDQERALAVVRSLAERRQAS